MKYKVPNITYTSYVSSYYKELFQILLMIGLFFPNLKQGLAPADESLGATFTQFPAIGDKVLNA